MPTPVKVIADLMRLYMGYQTIPLAKPTDPKKLKKGESLGWSKRPRDKAWTKTQYNSGGVIAKCIAENRNMGVRLTAKDMVIDVDPRNGGAEGLARLVADLKLDLGIFPRVVTGSGGFHLYARKYHKRRVVDTLEAYPGVEFKSSGRQVVSAGSIHPETLKPYLFDTNFPILAEAPKIADNFQSLILRPDSYQGLNGGGELDQEQVAAILENLDVTEFGDNDSWLRIMMAVHHASAGDARPEFVEWSIGDERYCDEAESIGRRWDSLSREKPGAITIGTLNKILKDRDLGHLAVKSNDAKSDFEFEDTPEIASGDDFEGNTTSAKNNEYDFEGSDEPDFEGDDDEFEADNEPTKDDEAELGDGMGRDQWLLALNAKYGLVQEGSNLRVITCDDDPIMGRKHWLRIRPADFEKRFSNRQVANPHDPNKMAKLGLAWMEWPGRKTYDRVLFDPTRVLENSPKKHGKSLNLFVGWGFEPDSRGEWSYLKEMLFEALCGGDESHLEYVLNWSAYMFQYPEQPAETAIVFKGGQGVGKGTWGNALARITGQHGMAISSPDLLTGRFNSHFQDLIYLFADEAIKPYDKVAESKLKAIITEKTLAIEGKGKDATVTKNYLHINMASNASWVVQADMDARRYFILDATSKWHGQFERFHKLHNQLNQNGHSGYKALLSFLLTRDLKNWHPARNMPTTDALIEQKIHSLTALQIFFFDAVLEGRPPCKALGDWSKEPILIARDDFRDAFSDFCRDNNKRFTEKESAYFLMKSISRIFPAAETNLTKTPWEERDDLTKRSDGRIKALTIPSLPECRAAFHGRFGRIVDWDTLGIRKEDWE